MVRRKELFQRYARDAGLDADQLALRLMLSPVRIHDLLSGRAPISNELATHIEEMLQLPASWLDQGGALEPGDPPMIDAPTQATAQAAPPAAEAQPAAAVVPAGVAVPARPATDKKQIHEHRRLNLTMLTAERGTKNRLAQLAGTSGSRISLMTSARKPVSDPFAFAIEDGLGLPRGWLDQPRSPDSVPAAVWQSLQVDSTAATAAAAIAATPARPAAAARPRQPAANPPRASAAAALAPAAAVAAATPAAPEASGMAPVAGAATPSAAASAQPAPAASPAGGTGLFDKPAGQCGPIAEALAKTILNLSATDKLSEARAFQLLGVLIAETSPAR